MFYVYVLRSRKDKMLYVGFTRDLKSRFEAHNAGKVNSTKARVPFELLYYEACRQQADALYREKYLKTTYGHRYLRNRLRGEPTS
jgi:putative endonuclease